MATPQYDLPFPQAERLIDPSLLGNPRINVGAPAPTYVIPPPPPAAPPKLGTFTDIGHGFARGAMVALPEMTGQALQAFGADQAGHEMAAAARARGESSDYQVNPEGWGEAASMVVPALATAGMGLIPGVGQVAAPLSAAALFGGSQYTQTRERGGTVGQALGTAAVQGVGQAAMAAVGAKFLQGAGNLIKPMTAQSVLNEFTPGVAAGAIGRTLANTIKTGAIQVPTQMAAQGGVAAIESDLPGTPGAWEAAKASVGPSLMMTALMAPFAGAGTAWHKWQRTAVGDTVMKPVDGYEQLSPAQKVQAEKFRLDNARQIWKAMGEDRSPQAKAWWESAQNAIGKNAAVKMDVGWNFDAIDTAQQQAEKNASQPGQLALPAPQEPAGLIGQPTPGAEMYAPGEERPTGGAEMVSGAEHANDALWAARDAEEQRQADLRTSKQPPPPDIPRRVGIDEVAERVKQAEIDTAYQQREQQKQADLALLRNESQLPKAEYDAAVTERSGDVSFKQLKDAWDKALADAPTWHPVAEGELTPARATEVWDATKQDRVQWLKDALGKGVGVGKLADMGPTELAAELQRKWMKNGGENGAQIYQPNLEALYKGVTGKDIREVNGESTATTQAAQGAKPETAAVTTGTKGAGNAAKVDEAARHANALQKEVAGANLSSMSYEQLDQLHERAQKHNSAVERASILKHLGQEALTEFDSKKTDKSRTTWWNDHATVEMDQFNTERMVDEERIRNHRDAVNDFDTESPQSLGRSLLLHAKEMDKPGFVGSPAYTAMQNAFRFAKEQGWDLDKVTQGLRARATEIYGADAPEMMARLFREPSAQAAPAARQLGGPTNANALQGQEALNALQQEQKDLAAGKGVDYTTSVWTQMPGRADSLAKANQLLRGIQDATGEGKVEASGVGERQGTDVVGAPAAAGGGNRVVASEEGGAPTAEVQTALGPKEAERYTKALQTREEAKTALEGARRQLLESLQERAKLNAEIASGTTTQAHLDAARLLDDKIDARNSFAEAALKSHSSALGRVESIESGHEPTGQISHYAKLLTQPFHPTNLNTYLDAQVLSGRATAEEQSLYSGQDRGVMTRSSSVITAVNALKRMPPEVLQQYHDYAVKVEHTASVAADMLRMGRRGVPEEMEATGERPVPTAASAEVAQHVQDMLKAETDKSAAVARVVERVSAGEITPEQGMHLLGTLAAAVNAAEAKADAAGTGPAKMDDVSLLRQIADELGVKYRAQAGAHDVRLALSVSNAPFAVDTMRHIAENHANSLVRGIAKIFAAANPTTTIRVIDNPDFIGGRFVPRTNTIEIGRGGMNPITLLHETAHALTHAAIDRAYWHERADFKTLKPQEVRELNALKMARSVMEGFRDIADINNPTHVLALQDEHEFLSEALHNPSITAALGGKRNLWTKLLQGVGQALGLGKAEQTQYEKLVDAAQTLFGDPNHKSLDVFYSAMTRPDHDMDLLNRGLGKMSTVSNALSGAWKNYSLNNLTRSQNLHSWLTYTDASTRLGWVLQDASKKFPALAPVFDRVQTHFDGMREAVNFRKTEKSDLIHGPGEANEVAMRLAGMHRTYPQQMEQLGKMARSAVATGVFPWAKNFTEAEVLNPTLTPEQWSHPAAVEARAAYKRLEQFSNTLGAGADTPVKLYRDTLEQHQRDYARNMADILRTTFKTYGFDTQQPLDYQQHRFDANFAPRPVGEQKTRLNDAIASAQREVAAAVKAGTAPEGLQQSVNALLTGYNEQRAKPYFHLGHNGTHYITFQVAPGASEAEAKANWDKVGQVVGKTLTEGGLERDWRDVLPSGNRRVYMKFDEQNHADAVAKLDALRNAGLFDVENADGEIQSTWSSGPVQNFSKATAGATPAFIREMRARIDQREGWTTETKEQMKQSLNDLYLQQLPETSPLKASADSDAVAGASRDTVRSIIDRMEMSNQSLVNSRAARRFAESTTGLDAAIKEMNGVTGVDINDYKNQVGVYVNELKARQADMQQPVSLSPVVQKMKALTAIWRLGLAPMYIAMVAYQPWQITMPALGGKFGYVEGAKAMAKNTVAAWGMLNSAMKAGWLQSSAEGKGFLDKLVDASNVTLNAREMKNPDGSPLYSPHQLDLLDHLMKVGLINFGMARQIYRMDPDEGSPLSTAKSGLSKAAAIAQIFPHYIEMSNRIVAAMAAHDLMFAKGDPAKGIVGGTDAAHDYAKKYAMEVIRNTDGDHSQVNIARKLGAKGFAGQTTPLFVGFGQYDIQMTEYLARTFQRAFLDPRASAAEKREMRKVLGGIAVSTAGIAGTLGLPFVGAAAGLWNAVVQMAQEDGDTPPDAEKSWRDFVHSMVGGGGTFGGAGATGGWEDKAEEVISRGLPRLAGIDMSGRSGYQDLLPFTGLLTNRAKLQDRIEQGSFDFLGPAVGAMAGIVTGAHDASRGDWVKASNEAMPAFMRNASKAYMMSKYGYETSGANNQIPIKADGWDAALQAIGALSSQKAEQTEKSYALQVNQQILQARHQYIMNDIMRGFNHQDFPAMSRAMQSSINFAVQQPQFRHFDVRQAIASQAQQRVVGGLPGMEGVMMPARGCRSTKRSVRDAPWACPPRRTVMADIPLSWRLGIDNISTKTNLPHGAVVDAVNTDIDRAGTLGRRGGYASVHASNAAHDLWTSEARNQSFCIIDGVLCQITMPWQATALYTLEHDAPFSYTDLNGEIVCGSRYETLVIGADLSVRRLGLETPGSSGVDPAAMPANAGGLDAGQYAVALAYMRGDEEGPLSRLAYTTLTAGQGLQLTIPQPNENLPTRVRIYRTQANGDVLMRVTDIPIGLPSYLLGVTSLGRQTKNWGTARMIPGDFVRYWRGLLWTVRNNVAYHSKSLWYGVYSPRFHFVQMQSVIRMFEPVENGIFIGTKEGVFFLSGKGPKDFEVHKTGGLPPVSGTARRVPAALLGEDGDTGEYVAVWLAGNGFVIGKGDGTLIEHQRRRITLEGSTGAVGVFNRRITATVL